MLVAFLLDLLMVVVIGVGMLALWILFYLAMKVLLRED